ncbi:MAG: zinc ribbon domain-containing protein [Phycisphaerales bacterium]|nr:zinc ribbon domain-containing protein [Phycisphaerae bacterium]NNF42910.1 zinc ribbon domain-containing protein [Phycisphaerales bacterium]NNM25070.1 zinc ribbon domain-containing protein [Phycisphaerales bacterium]
MPTYDYQCEACGHEFELFQSMTARVKRTCPECSKPKLKRLVGTGAGVIFKGSGFYETDYRSDSYKKAAEADKKPSGDGKKDAKKKGDGGATKKDAGKSKSSGAEST